MEKQISKLNKDELLAQLETWFTNASTFDKTWKDKSREMYSWYHGHQWTAEDIEVLQERNQAVTTFNHIAPTIDSIIGGERVNRPKIRMAGRTADDEQVAEVKTNLYEYIQYSTKTDDEFDKAILDCLVAGRGTIYINPTVGENNNSKILHQFIDFRDMFIDPLSRRDDLMDARYVSYAVFVDEDVLAKNFKDYIPVQDGTPRAFGFDGSSEDDLWYENNTRNRPRMITTWYADENGDISVAIWIKGKMLYSKKNPYKMNRYPYMQLTYKRDMDNTPYGLVNTMVSAQEEINKRHSKALHYLNSSQVLAEENAFKDIEQAKKTLAMPNGVTILSDGALAESRVQIVPTAQLAQSQIEMMQIAEQKLLSSAGINQAYIGQTGQYQSAKSMNISINSAQNTLIPFLNKVRIARFNLAEITMKLVPEFMREKQLLRILNVNGSYSFMPVNQIQALDDGTLAKINDLTIDDVDVIIEDAPRGLNEKEEQFNQLLTIQGQTSKPIPMEILLRYSSLKDKYQLAKELEQYNAMEAQMQQAQQIIMQLQEQIKQLGGQVQQQQSVIVQTQTARQVEKEVNKQKEQLGFGGLL